MSLGQLTADYADSDAEDEQQNETNKKNKILQSRPKEAPPPPIISVINPQKDDKRQQEKPRRDSTDKKKEQVLATTLESKDELPAGLSGVIIDDDDDAPPPPSPPHPRVEELRGVEAGSTKVSPGSTAGSGGSSRNTPVKRVNRLVSYYNEEDDLDDDSASDEEPDEVLHSEPMDTGTDGEGDSSSHPSRTSSPRPAPQATIGGWVMVDGIKLPPAPVGKKCSQALQDKVAKAIASLKRGGRDYNTIQCKKEFRNPSIYEKLVDLIRLDENGTNYPVDRYDPHCWGKESFYEELARVQKEEMEKREKERKDRAKVDFVSGTKKTEEAETKKRKSRFDACRTENGPMLASAVPKAIVLATNLPAKTTIDAFGSLNKKVKS